MNFEQETPGFTSLLSSLKYPIPPCRNEPIEHLLGKWESKGTAPTIHSPKRAHQAAD